MKEQNQRKLDGSELERNGEKTKSLKSIKTESLKISQTDCMFITQDFLFQMIV